MPYRSEVVGRLLGPPHPAFKVWALRLNCATRVRIVAGDPEIAPGGRVHREGGHTAGLRLVTVTSTATSRPGRPCRSSRACPRC
jgi:hypothetical protein